PNGKVLVAAGYSSGSLTSAEVYDPTTGSWTPTGSLGVARNFHTASLLQNGKVLVAGGSNDSGFLTATEVYDPGTGSWSAAGNRNAARSEHTSTLLPNGKVLVAGGESNSG